ncbi:19710_t:CDS:2 [Funneliformis geosporum]|uniref:19710_t:CDS:1 n=1 Tax=Funneliformis geosporum TaxID=1117311 RepID=A0A9W4SQG5_9GLOM|nr:19710_t:CDS:2 [Funneliformis geosporum]
MIYDLNIKSSISIYRSSFDGRKRPSYFQRWIFIEIEVNFTVRYEDGNGTMEMERTYS